MALSTTEVQHIARLAALALSPAEVERLAGELTAILEHVDQLNEVDTRDVPATAHVRPASEAERDDEPRPCLDAAAALANAPDGAPDAGLFRVPRVIGG